MESEPKLPETIDPDGEQKLFEKLSMDDQEYEYLEIIRRHMRYIYKEEHKKEQDGN